MGRDRNKGRRIAASKNDRTLNKSGDTIILKLVARGKKSDDHETKYLSIHRHRGWWLKSVSSVPRKNRFFAVHIHEMEFAGRGDRIRANNQSSNLTLAVCFRYISNDGNSIVLEFRERRWVCGR